MNPTHLTARFDIENEPEGNTHDWYIYCSAWDALGWSEGTFPVVDGDTQEERIASLARRAAESPMYAGADDDRDFDVTAATIEELALRMLAEQRKWKQPTRKCSKRSDGGDCVELETSTGGSYDPPEPPEYGIAWPPQCEHCGLFMPYLPIPA